MTSLLLVGSVLLSGPCGNMESRVDLKMSQQCPTLSSNFYLCSVVNVVSTAYSWNQMTYVFLAIGNAETGKCYLIFINIMMCVSKFPCSLSHMHRREDGRVGCNPP